jgi:ribosome-associated protein
MIVITDRIAIAESELDFESIRASGPGGQHVNKTESAIQLRFDARRSPALDEGVRLRLRVAAGRRMTDDGVIVIAAKRFRSQEANKKDAVARLVELLRLAAEPPRRRWKTRPSRAAEKRRQVAKKTRSAVKRLRTRIEDD